MGEMPLEIKLKMERQYYNEP